MKEMIYKAETLNVIRSFISSLRPEATGLINDIYDAVNHLLSVQPKTGKWIPCCVDSRLMTFDFKCSNCGVHTYTRIPKYIDTMEYAYCPYCGAKMVKEGEEHD